MELKVNQKVIAKEDIRLSNLRNEKCIIKKNTTGIITKTYSLFGIQLYRVKFDGHEGKFVSVVSDDIEPIKEELSCKLVVNQFGNKIIASGIVDNKPLTGTARCNPEDKFDFKTGMLIAIARAYGDKKLEDFVLHPDKYHTIVIPKENSLQYYIKGIDRDKVDELNKINENITNDYSLDSIVYALMPLLKDEKKVK